jgi:hypothetical protein
MDWQREYDRLTATHGRWLEELLKNPSVTMVGIGLKATGGRRTQVPSIRVFVRKKLPLAEIDRALLIPKSLHGIPTDVEQAIVRRAAFPGEPGEPEVARPLIGGVMIGAVPEEVGQTIDAGTLGCFVKTRDTHKICLLTNQHVVQGGITSKIAGLEVFQPLPGDSCCGLTKETPIGRVLNVAINATPTDPYPLDAAIVALDPRGEKTGLTYNPGVVEVGAVVGSHRFTPQELLSHTYSVKKRGASTHLREGTITDVNLGGSIEGRRFFGALQITTADPSKRYSQHGDSGSLTLNSANEGVALHFGVSTPSDDAPPADWKGLVCLLEDPPDGTNGQPAFKGVLNELEVDLITGGGIGAPAIAVPANNMDGVPVFNAAAGPAAKDRFEQQAILDRAERELARSPAGSALAQVFKEHRDEIIRLVNRDRRVSYAWMKHGGPFFVWAFISALDKQGAVFPQRVGDMSADECLRAVLEALKFKGSADLSRDIDNYQDFLLSLGGRSFGSVLEELEVRS